MKVIKRNGHDEEVSFDKVLKRIKTLSGDLQIDVYDIAQKVVTRIYDHVKTCELDELAAQICSSMIADHPDYGTMASRIIISNHHKNTSPSFSETITLLFNNVDDDNLPNPLVSEQVYNTVMNNKEKLNSYLDYTRDYNFDYFGFKTIEKAYLMRINNLVIERPQHMFMRVALGIHGVDVKDALLTYDLMSTKYFVHATPTLFNAGTPRPQCSSCYLMGMEDSIEGIYDIMKESAQISKYAGGIGMWIHDIRARNSRIRGTNGTSTGIVPMLKVANYVARHVNQCFTPDTIVYTDIGPKEIQYVKPFDMVITKDGSLRRVNQVVKNYVSKQILQIQIVSAFQPVTCTKEHEIYVIKNTKKDIDHGTLKDLLSQAKIVPEFIPASQVQDTHYVGFPITDHVQDDQRYDADFFRMYGIMVSTGRMFNKTYVVTLYHDCKLSTLNFIKSFLRNLGVHYSIKDYEGFSVVSWAHNPVFPLLYDDIYDNIGQKKINQYWLYLPLNKIQGLVQGLLETKGGTQKEVHYDTTSYNVALSLRFMLMRLGILSSGFIKNDINSPKQCCYVLSVPKEHSPDYFIYDNIMWSQVSHISTVDYSGFVYDLNVQDNHNYTTDLGLVHNSGRRNGSIAVYIEPWHADIEQFLEMKLPQGAEEDRARDLFYALWIPDLFMKRVKENGIWSLMCPNQCKGLSDNWGSKFEDLYLKYEAEGKYVKQVKAQELWFKVLESQIETGTPYLCFKDAANGKSNQQNLGTIKSSNLCVAGDTKVLTNLGWIPIEQMKDKSAYIWNGEKFSESVVSQTGINQKLLTIKFSNGLYIKCTPYHRFSIVGHSDPVEAKDLVVDMEITPFEFPQFEQERHNILLSHIEQDRYNIESPDWDYIMEVFLYLSSQGKYTTIEFEGNRYKIVAHDTPQMIKVSKIEDNEEYGDTYCFNEPVKHMGVFNGILTYNCSEIIEYSDQHETAVCNLASICLPTYVKTDVQNKPYFDFEKLHEVVKVITKNLNKVIDINFYPVEKTRRSNLRHRPIGIGVQGLADTFVLMRYPFDSVEAQNLNRFIFETIYHAAVSQSMEIAKKRHEIISNTTSQQDYDLHLNEFERTLINSKYPGAYSTFEGSPASRGILQFDLWNVKQTNDRYDWDSLKADIQKYGMRNSLLLAPMPTASTSQIMGFNECHEPFTSNMYKRKTIAGEFVLVNKYLVKDLSDLNLWSKDMKNRIIVDDGSIQNIPEIPQNIKDLYKIVWEIKQKVLIDMAVDRGVYVCQSQSLNLFVEDPTFQKLSSMHFYSWQQGLKTGIYYLRTRPKASAVKFTIDPNLIKNQNQQDEGCLMCSA